MDFPILQSEIQEYIKANTRVSISKVALVKNPFSLVAWTAIVEQIESRQKSEHKLPSWFQCDRIIYPNKISVEQSSSEKTAAYKASLIAGDSLIDLTGGFGVDAYYFSKKFTSVVHCEMNELLSSIVAHNFCQLKVNNARCIAGNSETILRSLPSKFDWMYIDPARRNDIKGKVFMLKDCSPNIVDLMDYYFEFSDNILIKTSPILDLAAGFKELKFVKSIHIVAVNNEVKELLWVLKKGHIGQTEVVTVNIKELDSECFKFQWKKDNTIVTYALPKTYIYEPNSAIMKSGAFDEVSSQFMIDKLHSNSHLYTSDQPIPFPGRIFKVVQIIPYQKREMKSNLEGKKANVTTRNFTETVDQIRKKWKILDGGTLFCFFTTDLNNSKIVLICNKI